VDGPHDHVSFVCTSNGWAGNNVYVCGSTSVHLTFPPLVFFKKDVD
jgi:hypothetical protein